MIVTCGTCKTRYDDEFRLTFCPHETFEANDGRNNFAHHPESHISHESEYCPQCGVKLQENHCKLICPLCGYYMSCSDYY